MDLDHRQFSTTHSFTISMIPSKVGLYTDGWDRVRSLPCYIVAHKSLSRDCRSLWSVYCSAGPPISPKLIDRKAELWSIIPI